MDPLSLTMAIVGLLTASQHISSAIGSVVSRSRSAPKEIQNVKSTVDTIRSVLIELQMLLLGRAKVDRQRTSLILVEQIVITLSACVATFSELDVFVGTLDSDAMLGLMDRIRWATKTSTIKEHVQKLEMHKSSLTLMLTILTCESTNKAEDAVDALSMMIQQMLENHRVLAQRLLSIEIGLNIEQPLTSHLPETSEPILGTIQRNAGGLAFEEVLKSSWVYQRSDRRGDSGSFSVISSGGRTASWSMLSGLSLSDNISIVAFQALPVYAQDLSNAEVYKFGEFNDGDVVLPEDESIAKDSRSFRVITAETLRKDQAIAAPNIFGVPLRNSIAYAKTAINVIDESGQRFLYGYVPIIVKKMGDFLQNSSNDHSKKFYSLRRESITIFTRTGSATRISELESAFDDWEKLYGRLFSWERVNFAGRDSKMDPTPYDVYDAASCLLRYLKLLPEPVIPLDFYDQFTAVIDDEHPPDFAFDGLLPDDFVFPKFIPKYRRLITSLPPPNRYLLVYLLDLIDVFASRSDNTKMASQRIVAAFQPALLSRPPSEMSASDYALAADTMVFLIGNQDHFLSGYKAPERRSKRQEVVSTHVENTGKAPST